MIINKHLPRQFTKWAPAWLLLCGLAMPVCAQDQSLDHDDFGSSRSKVMNVIDSKSSERDASEKPVPTFSHPALESRYIADRDAAIARFTPEKVPNIDDKIDADEEQARAALEADMRAIITSAPAGFGKGTLNLSTLFTGDEGFGTLDGLIFEGDGGKAHMIVTTLSLLQRWLDGHKSWWPEGPMPSDPQAAFGKDGFYTQAVDTDSAILRFAPIALGISDGVAFLASRTQDAMPKAADEIFVAAVKGDRAFVAYRTLAEPVSVPACTKARAAVKKPSASDAADKAFARCFAAGAPKAAHFADAVGEAKGLYDAMK